MKNCQNVILISLAIGAFLILFTTDGTAQLALNITEYTQTDGDYYYQDDMAGDACSYAYAFPYAYPTGYSLDEFALEIYSNGCDFSVAEGYPYAEIDFNIYISNPPANTFPAKSYLNYTIPFGFKTDVSITNYGGDYISEYNYATSYGSISPTFSSSAYNNLVGPTTYNESFSSESNLILPKSDYYYSYNISLFGQNDPLETVSVVAIGTDAKLLLPSQFFVDNGISIPTAITISGYTFGVETVCAENIFYDNVELDSYHYSAAGHLTMKSKIINGAIVSISADNGITLDSGFTVDASSSFSTLTYTGCTN